MDERGAALLGRLSSPAVVRTVGSALGLLGPVVRLPRRTVLVVGAPQVRAVLGDHERFASGPAYEGLLPFPFVLGTDDDDRHAAERAWIEARLRAGAGAARAAAARTAADQLATVTDDVVDVAALARVVAAEAVPRAALGLDPPAARLATWSARGFRTAFNRWAADDVDVEAAGRALAASQSAARSAVSDGVAAPGDLAPDDAERTLRGALVAANEVVQACVGVVDHLLADGELLAEARAARAAGDDAALRHVVLRALHWSPSLPVLVRDATADVRLGRWPLGRVRAGDRVVAVLPPALADELRAGRLGDGTPLVFGAGRHACPAADVALAVVAEVVGALLDAAPRLRRAPNRAGRVRRVGLEADRLVVALGAGAAARPGRRPRQSGATIELDVAAHHVGAVQGVLDRSAADGGDPLTPLTDAGLHFGSVVLWPHRHDDRATLLVELTADGPADAFLDTLAARSADALTPLLERCEGWPRPVGAESDPAVVAGFLRAHDRGPGSHFCAWRRQRAADVRREEALWALVSEHLCAAADRDELRHADERARFALDLVRTRPDLSWVHLLPGPTVGARLAALAGRPAVRRAVGAGVVVGAVLAARPRLAGGLLAAGVAAPAGLSGLRRGWGWLAERRPAPTPSDWEAGWRAVEDDVERHLAPTEAVPSCHHHLFSATTVADRPLRRAYLGAVLAAVRLLAATTRDGRLGPIDMIHSARWVRSRDGRHLYFFSNYDGTWDDYLDDFIDRGASWLNLLWWPTTNEVGYPPTRWVTGGGARDVRRFKAYVRRSQAPASVWVRAYPDVPVTSVGRNRALRSGLAGVSRGRWADPL